MKTFEEFYQSIFGSQWSSLKTALLREGVKASLSNHAIFNQHAESYELDPASIVVAKALQARPGDSVLDMCAAPGGKTLVILQDMGGQGHVLANDSSRDRMFRLRRNLSERLHSNALESTSVINQDARQLGIKNRDRFDRVLLDAPCSGERHLLENPAELAGWTESRSKNLAAKQYALLCSGMLALKIGGRLVYSTCALSPYENDQVIARYLKKKSDAKVITSEVVSQLKSAGLEVQGESLEHGFQTRPDLHEGWGPMYFCVLEKVP